MKQGTKIQVNGNHEGARWSTGRVVAVEVIRGRTYYDCRLTGGRAAGIRMRFLARELVNIEQCGTAFVCPHCDRAIDETDMARHLAGKGGRKSRRKLSTAAARDMAKRSAEARRKKKADQE